MHIEAYLQVQSAGDLEKAPENMPVIAFCLGHHLVCFTASSFRAFERVSERFRREL